MKWFLAFILLSILFTVPVNAQNRGAQNRFGAGIVVGFNTSQINGDSYSGFNKFGGFAGLRATMRINTTTELVVEMQYNSKGSKNPEQSVPGRPSRFIALDYIQVPILLRKKIGSTEGSNSLEFGIAYARVFGIRINELVNSTNYATFTAIQDDFNKEELAVVLGGGILVSEHVQLIGRFIPSLTLLYKNPNPNPNLTSTVPDIRSLRNFQLAFGLNYAF